MKKFSFPLTRVMEWRRTEARIEEAALERLYAGLQAIDMREALLNEERAQSEKAVLRQSSTTGAELASLDGFKRFIVAERFRIQRLRTECHKKISAQLHVVTLKRRDVRLLEKLKDERLKTWNVGLAHEIDQQAEESYLAKWNR